MRQSQLWVTLFFFAPHIIMILWWGKPYNFVVTCKINQHTSIPQEQSAHIKLNYQNHQINFPWSLYIFWYSMLWNKNPFTMCCSYCVYVCVCVCICIYLCVEQNDEHVHYVKFLHFKSLPCVCALYSLLNQYHVCGFVYVRIAPFNPLPYMWVFSLFLVSSHYKIDKKKKRRKSEWKNR